jgi:hypothetical protein
MCQADACALIFVVLTLCQADACALICVVLTLCLADACVLIFVVLTLCLADAYVLIALDVRGGPSGTSSVNHFMLIVVPSYVFRLFIFISVLLAILLPISVCTLSEVPFYYFAYPDRL